MKRFFKSPLTSPSGGLTLMGFFWAMVASLTAFLLPIFLFVE